MSLLKSEADFDLNQCEKTDEDNKVESKTVEVSKHNILI